MSNIDDICNQYKLNRLNNIPPVRYEPINPYLNSTLTKFQLDMRRKTEILKYKKSSSQGSQLTQKQIQSQIYKGNFNPAKTVCPDDYKIPVLSTAAGIPGPPMYLVEDRNIPLYNFVKNTNAYAEQAPEDDTQWIISTNTNEYCQPDFILTTIAALNIKNKIELPRMVFNYATPVIFRLQGNNMNSNHHDITANATIDTSKISFEVYYNNSLIANNNLIHISFNPLHSTNSIVTKIQKPTGTDTYNYLSEMYVGILNINNILLTTSPGFNYEFRIRYNVDITTSSEDPGKDNEKTFVEENSVFSMYVNIDDNYSIQQSVNSEITSILQSPPDKIITFIGNDI
tara:strand:- start:2140 stop:3165 length:1026 start_codon:yes stop_codon:yes gene_type:complete